MKQTCRGENADNQCRCRGLPDCKLLNNRRPLQRLRSGSPMRAIARACQIPSSELRAQLEAAHKDGRIVDLPKEDWPPYDVRSRRTVAEDRDQQAITLRALTGATKAEASLLLDLLLAGSLCRARYPSPGAIDVHAHYLRKKLAPHRIT